MVVWGSRGRWLEGSPAGGVLRARRAEVAGEVYQGQGRGWGRYPDGRWGMPWGIENGWEDGGDRRAVGGDGVGGWSLGGGRGRAGGVEGEPGPERGLSGLRPGAEGVAEAGRGRGLGGWSELRARGVEGEPDWGRGLGVALKTGLGA